MLNLSLLCRNYFIIRKIILISLCLYIVYIIPRYLKFYLKYHYILTHGEII